MISNFATRKSIGEKSTLPGKAAKRDARELRFAPSNPAAGPSTARLSFPVSASLVTSISAVSNPLLAPTTPTPLSISIKESKRKAVDVAEEDGSKKKVEAENCPELQQKLDEVRHRIKFLADEKKSYRTRREQAEEDERMLLQQMGSLGLM